MADTEYLFDFLWLLASLGEYLLLESYFITHMISYNYKLLYRNGSPYRRTAMGVKMATLYNQMHK
jgi:hypothetical protein